MNLAVHNPDQPAPVSRPSPPPERPSLPDLVSGFARVSLLSVGGGLTAWIRRLVVERKGWMDERGFLSGYALSQVAPGPNAVNLAVFVGATLRGVPGALCALGGLMLPPLVLVLLLGWLYATHAVPAPVSRALAGMGAAAIGLVIATGLRMARPVLRGVLPVGLCLLVCVALVLGVRLLLVVAVAFPLALVLPASRSQGRSR